MKTAYDTTIGVEVEMNGISRCSASEIAADYFGTSNPCYIGDAYKAWGAYDKMNRLWQFVYDSSISGPDDEKCELVTPILHYDDMELLFGLLNQLKIAGAQSNPNSGCGIHLHLGLGDHTAKTLTNLARIMAAHEEQLAKAIHVDKYRLEHYCKPIEPYFLRLLHAHKPKNMDELAAVWYIGNYADDDRDFHYNPSRYHALNYHACFTKGTIEFRLFQFSDKIDCDELRAYIQLVLAINELAKNVKFASTRKPQNENDKYAFRVWLLRLGFIGDEFRTSRRILLKHLKGDCAWRHI